MKVASQHCDTVPNKTKDILNTEKIDFYIQKEEVFSAIGSFSQNRDGGRSIHLDWIGGHFIGCLSQPSRVGEIRAGIGYRDCSAMLFENGL